MADLNKLPRVTIDRIGALIDGNLGSGSVIAAAGERLPKVLDQLEKFNIKGSYIWCLFMCKSKGDREKAIDTIIEMKESPTGYCSNGHDWGPSRCEAQTQCFGIDCMNEGTKYCSKCYSVRYCSRECQSAAWQGGHNKRCNANVMRIKEAVNKMGVYKSAARIFDLHLLTEHGVVQFMKKYYDA
jgi:hypothetical protein